MHGLKVNLAREGRKGERRQGNSQVLLGCSIPNLKSAETWFVT